MTMNGRGHTRRRWGALALAAALGAMLTGACGGGAAVGDDCETPGSVDECEDGAICDADSDLGTVCMTLCEKDEDCADGETCKGTSGSLKGCHPN
jgi:hypothetical protein